LVLLALLALAPPPVKAQPATGLLPVARRQMDEAQFEEAKRTLERALRDPRGTPATRVEAYRLLGVVSVYLNDKPAAERAFASLLDITPDYQFPKGSASTVREIFDRVKSRVDAERVRLVLEPPTDVIAGRPATFVAEIEGMQRSYRAFLYYRRPQSDYRFEEFQPAEGRRFSATVPPAALPVERQSYPLEYYAEVQDGSRRRLASAGESLSPLRSVVKIPMPTQWVTQNGKEPPPPPDLRDRTRDDPWYKKWWVWTIVGGVAASAAVTTVLLWPDEPAQGRVPVNITSP
jgi:hypothetical protein